MKLAVTGGGTGGHVFPAVELALAARAAGHDVRYLGSMRGIEGKQCAEAGIEFLGFSSEPLYRLASPKGVRSAVRMARALAGASRALAARQDECVFSTGGYASAPVVQAARRLGVPYVLHEQNSVPGRTNRMLGPGAAAVCTVFAGSEPHFAGCKVVRSGMPVRGAFRQSGQGRLPEGFAVGSADSTVLVVGGSQGSVALNDIALATAVRMARMQVHWIHLTGLAHFEPARVSLEKMGMKTPYDLRAYLDAETMAAAMFSSSVVVCRSGAGTLAELAAMRRPSILVPYPSAFGDHQTANAREFAEMGAAELLPQPSLSATSLEARLHAWLVDRDRYAEAQAALAAWDRPGALAVILQEVERAAGAVAA